MSVLTTCKAPADAMLCSLQAQPAALVVCQMGNWSLLLSDANPVCRREGKQRSHEQTVSSWCRLSHLCRNCTQLRSAGTRNSGRRSLDKGLFYTSSTRFLINNPTNRPTNTFDFVCLDATFDPPSFPPHSPGVRPPATRFSISASLMSVLVRIHRS